MAFFYLLLRVLVRLRCHSPYVSTFMCMYAMYTKSNIAVPGKLEMRDSLES